MARTWITIRAHYDGKVIVPDEPVDLPAGQELEVEVRPLANREKVLTCLDAEGVAWIDGTTTKVIEVVLNQLASGLSPQELQSELPHLSPAQIDAALAYCDAHRRELDTDIERRRRWVEQLRAQEEKPLTRAELLERKKRLG